MSLPASSNTAKRSWTARSASCARSRDSSEWTCWTSAREVTAYSFAARAPAGWEPTLNEEHDEYRWTTVEEALSLLHWPEAREAVRRLAAHLKLSA